MSKNNFLKRQAHLKTGELILFADNLAVMLKAGLTLSESLALITEQTTGRQKKIISAIAIAVDSGSSFADAIVRYPRAFPGIFLRLVKTGEISGNLAENLRAITVHLSKQKETKDKIKSALIYPGIILLIALIMSIFIGLFILPKIIPVLLGLHVALPVWTRLIIGFSNFMSHYGFLAAACFFITIIALITISRIKLFKPFFHAIYLRLPLVSFFIKISQLAIICRTLAMLTRSGFAIDEALEASAYTSSNYYYQNVLLRLAQNAREGQVLSDSLKKWPQYFPVLTWSMIRIGEKTGSLESQFSTLADMYDKEIDYRTKNLTVILEPVLLVLVGLLVGVFALGIITPIYQISGSIH